MATFSGKDSVTGSTLRLQVRIPRNGQRFASKGNVERHAPATKEDKQKQISLRKSISPKPLNLSYSIETILNTNLKTTLNKKYIPKKVTCHRDFDFLDFWVSKNPQMALFPDGSRRSFWWHLVELNSLVQVERCHGHGFVVNLDFFGFTDLPF